MDDRTGPALFMIFVTLILVGAGFMLIRQFEGWPVIAITAAIVVLAAGVLLYGFYIFMVNEHAGWRGQEGKRQSKRK